eukprot:10469033-Alexandrium_andersonii.AAC.2
MIFRGPWLARRVRPKASEVAGTAPSPVLHAWAQMRANGFVRGATCTPLSLHITRVMIRGVVLAP